MQCVGCWDEEVNANERTKSCALHRLCVLANTRQKHVITSDQCVLSLLHSLRLLSYSILFLMTCWW